MGYKISNYERRCRELSEAGLIRAVKNEKRFIIGYLYQEKKYGDIKIDTEPRQDRLFTPGRAINN